MTSSSDEIDSDGIVDCVTRLTKELLALQVAVPVPPIGKNHTDFRKKSKT